MKFLVHRKMIIGLILLGLSAVPSPARSSDEATAERLVQEKLKEKLEVGSHTHYYNDRGDKVLEAAQADYTLHYELLPTSAEQPGMQEVNFTVEWRPLPDKPMVQRLRMKSYLTVKSDR